MRVYYGRNGYRGVSYGPAGFLIVSSIRLAWFFILLALVLSVSVIVVLAWAVSLGHWRQAGEVLGDMWGGVGRAA